MNHKYFTINERNKPEVLLKKNYKISKITQILNRHRAAIYRGIKRINGEYSSENAQSDANAKAANKGRNLKITSKLKKLIEDRLCKTWSPEQDSVVSARGESKVCFATFVELKTRFYVAIKMEDRRLDKNLNADKFKAKEMFKLCNAN